MPLQVRNEPCGNVHEARSTPPSPPLTEDWRELRVSDEVTVLIRDEPTPGDGVRVIRARPELLHDSNRPRLSVTFVLESAPRAW